MTPNNSQHKAFVPVATKAVSRLGYPFIKWVLSSYCHERITTRDLSEHLGIRLKHMAKIEETVMRKPVLLD